MFERRPSDARHLPGILNCFGGTRESGEAPDACLKRELIEELGFAARGLELCVELATPTGVGWYYRARGPDEGTARALEPGFGIEWVEPTDLQRAGVGSWNLVAIAAELRGERIAWAE